MTKYPTYPCQTWHPPAFSARQFCSGHLSSMPRGCSLVLAGALATEWAGDLDSAQWKGSSNCGYIMICNLGVPKKTGWTYTKQSMTRYRSFYVEKQNTYRCHWQETLVCSSCTIVQDASGLLLLKAHGPPKVFHLQGRFEQSSDFRVQLWGTEPELPKRFFLAWAFRFLTAKH